MQVALLCRRFPDPAQAVQFVEAFERLALAEKLDRLAVIAPLPEDVGHGHRWHPRLLLQQPKRCATGHTAVLKSVAHQHDAGVEPFGRLEKRDHIPATQESRLVYPDYLARGPSLHLLAPQEHRHRIGVPEPFLPQHVPAGRCRGCQDDDLVAPLADGLDGLLHQRRLAGPCRPAHQDDPVAGREDMPHGPALPRFEPVAFQGPASRRQGLACAPAAAGEVYQPLLLAEYLGRRHQSSPVTLLDDERPAGILSAHSLDGH